MFVTNTIIYVNSAIRILNTEKEENLSHQFQTPSYKQGSRQLRIFTINKSNK